MLVLLLGPRIGAAQQRQTATEITPRLLEEVLPAADRFSEKQGQPPVYQGYATDPATGVEALVGYVFLTADVPPEITGYSAPINTLVGMDLRGALTGMRVIYYRESLRSSRGDFLGRRTFEDQFAGKRITEPFSPRRDVDNISGATITVTATSLGIRNAARRVANAYQLAATASSSTPRTDIASINLESLRPLSWTEMVELGLGRQLSATNGPRAIVDVGLLYLRDGAMAEMLLGPDRLRSIEDWVGDTKNGMHRMLIGLSGPDAFLFRGENLHFVQGADTVSATMDDVVIIGGNPGGTIEGEFRRLGLLYVSPDLDVTRPFSIVLDIPRRGVFTSDYTVTRGGPALASAGATAPSGAASGDASQTPADGLVDPLGGSASDVALDAAAAQDPAALGPASATEIPPFNADDQVPLVFSEDYEEETLLARTLSQTSWLRVGLLVVLLALSTWAFLAKNTNLRLAVLGLTLLYLGFFDRGFLSISHITSGISRGPSVYLSDLPLLLMVSFTVVTTLLVGRVFCGYLCPFGAIQDFMERVVPRRFKRELPDAIHKHALKIKYALLAVVLAPALIGSEISIFQYFEPFGTVFFWSPSIVLWVIAIGILAASAVVPRFYCRYACPLGAALAVGSLLAPFRIKRVEQCQICKVCENKCPTGAITGPAIDFKECVRCNVCEIALIDKVGACKHSVEKIRPRLVKLTMARVGVADER
jgi:NosR/NirI family transcriptional regulator, nitrous oxide reductase regulator